MTKTEIGLGATTMGKDKKTKKYGIAYIDKGYGCDGFPDVVNTLFDTIEEARKKMEDSAEFFADSYGLSYDEIVHKGKNCIFIEGWCSWAIVTFEV